MSPLRRPSTRFLLRRWTRLAAVNLAALVALASRADAQQPRLGTPMPTNAPLPTMPVGPPTMPTTLPDAPPSTSPLQPSSLQSRQAASATTKVASQPIFMQQPIITPGATQPTMKELRQSLREDGLKNMGMPEFTSKVGAKPPTPPANMSPATKENPWVRLFTRTPDQAFASTDPSVPQTATVNPPPPPRAGVGESGGPKTWSETSAPTSDNPWMRYFSRSSPTPQPTAVPAPQMASTPPPTLQQTSGTVPPEQQSWWYRLTHRTSSPDAAPPPPNQGPMVLPEAVPLRLQ